MARPRKQDADKKMNEVKEISAKNSPAAEEKKTVKRGRPKKAESAEVKTAAKAEKKSAVKVSENKTFAVSEFVIQFEGNNYDIEQIKAKVNEAVNSSKKRGVKSVGIYVQPKERVVYYSVNGKDGGKIEL